MDPNETLRLMREYLRKGLAAERLYEDAQAKEAWEGAAMAAADLDTWLSKGGFPPDAWKPAGRGHNWG